MSDKERLIQLLRSFGIPNLAQSAIEAYGPANRDKPGYCVRTEGLSTSAAGPGYSELVLANGTGYPGFSCGFLFDQDGKFVSYGVWE